jgi:hypothetical protein
MIHICSDEEFARLSVRMGYLSKDQVSQLRRRQSEVSSVGAHLTFAELVETDLMLMPHQIKKVNLAAQYVAMLEKEKRLGAIAVKLGLASEDEVGFCIETQKYEFCLLRKIPRPLTDIMVEAEVLTPEKVDALRAGATDADVAGAARTMPYEGGKVDAPGPDESAVKGSSPGLPARNGRRPASAPALQAHSGSRPASGVRPVPISSAVRPAPSKAQRLAELAVDAETRRLKARLLVTPPDGLEASYPVRGRTVIGRAITCAVRIDDPRSSREHATIEYDEALKFHMVTDLGSRNGVLVNGVKITDATALKPGDEVMIGDTRIRYEA